MNYPWYVPICAENFIEIVELLLGDIITGRNEVVAKVMFLLVSVILYMGGGVIPACIAGGIPTCLAAGLLGGCLLWGGVCSGGCLHWGVSVPRGVSAPGGYLLQGGW